jgi:iron(III) transport system ATP-binding protein
MERQMIRLTDVTKRFDDVVALDEARLTVRRGEIVALLGPSGCGKTTLLRTIAGFERPDGGTIEIDGRPVTDASSWTPPERRGVGMVFQDYALFPHLTVAQNVGFGISRRDRRTRVPELLDTVGLAELGKRYPHQLSGGQQQRVALARALAPAPDVVLLDEPWSSVDPQLREELRVEVTAILRPLGVTVVLVTHDREEAFSLAGRIALMRDGRIVQAGSPEALYRSPATRWAAEFVGPANVLEGASDGGRVRTVIGSFPTPRADSERVGVVVRPELLALSRDPSGPAHVVEREFRGHDILYRLRVDGIELVSQRPSTESVEVGDRVRVTLLDDEHVTVLSVADSR